MATLPALEENSDNEQVKLTSISKKTDASTLGVESDSNFSDEKRCSLKEVEPAENPQQTSIHVSLFRKVKNWIDLTPESGKVELKKELTTISGVAFIVGQIIGSGIFITPSNILNLTGSFGTSIVAWVIGAIVSLAGALCYIEVGLVVKKSGGEFAYILEAYSFKNRNRWTSLLGSLLGFLVTWSIVFFIKASSVTIITLTCARYLIRPFFIGCEVPDSAVRLMALAVLTLLAILNCYSVKLVVRLITVFAVLKVFAIGFVLILGLVTVARKGDVSEDIHEPFKTFEDHKLSPSSLALALYSVMWAYDGWNALNYVIEETKNVEKTLARSLFIGVPIVATCYLLVNFAFFSILCYDEILGADAVAIPFGVKSGLGKGLFVIPLIVSLSTFGASLASMLTSTRIIHSAARDGLLPRMFSGVHNSYKTPVPAVLLVYVLAMVLISAGTITDLINGFGAASFSFYMMVFLSVIIMRFTHREQPRPFKVWFIIPVAVFAVLFSLFLIIVPLMQKEGRLPTLIALAVILLGVPVYIFLVMETPWKLRPKILDRIGEWLTRHSNSLLNTTTVGYRTR